MTAQQHVIRLTRQCLNRRIPDRPTLEQEVSAWSKARNETGTTLHWRYSLTDARINLPHLYPVPHDDTSR